MNLYLIIFIQYLLVTMDGLTSGIMIEFGSGGIEDRNASGQRMKRILMFWIMELILMLPKLISGDALTTSFGQFLQTIAYILMVRLIYRLSWMKSVGWFMAYLATAVTAELVFLSAHPDLLAYTANWTRQVVILDLAQTELLFFAFKMLLTRMILTKNASGWKDPFIALYVFYGIGLILVYPIVSCSETPYQTVILSAYIPFFLLICLFSVAYGIERWLHARFRLNIEASQNEQNMQNGDAAGMDDQSAKIRHDAHNIVHTVSHLLNQGQEKEAMDLLAELSAEISELGQEEAAPETQV